MLAERNSIQRDLEKVMKAETQLKERENEFYLVGHNLWAIETLQR